MRSGPGAGRPGLFARRLSPLRMFGAACVLASAGCLVVATQQGALSVDPGTSQAGRLPARAAPVAAAAPAQHPAPLDASVTPASSRPPRTDSRPARLRIPTIGVATRLSSLGLQEDATVEVPSDPDLAGWYRHGATPGSVGAAVILGHVDSAEGPAVFALLGTLSRGDAIEVVLINGRTVEFRVREVRTYLNEDFPAQRVYRGRRDHHDLNLVTCAGEYRSDAGGYQSNVVVFASQVRA